jgi:hypothetical protein
MHRSLKQEGRRKGTLAGIGGQKGGGITIQTVGARENELWMFASLLPGFLSNVSSKVAE